MRYTLADVYNPTLLFCQDSNENLHSNVKVQGMGVFFLVMPLAQTWLVGHEYMCFVCQITPPTCDISEMSRQGRPVTWPLENLLLERALFQRFSPQTALPRPYGMVII
jgi:hypothetical protein